MFVVNTEDNVDAHHDVGVAMYRAFNYVMKRESAVKALSFLTDVRLIKDIVITYRCNSPVQVPGAGESVCFLARWCKCCLNHALVVLCLDLSEHVVAFL